MGKYSANIDHVARIRIQNVRKWNYLKTGYTEGGICWTDENETIVSRISSRFSIDPDGESCMRLVYYLLEDRSGKQQGFDYFVSLVWVPCRFGGKRWYFLCPNANCGRRCSMLYSADHYFVCRKCTGLYYFSQSYIHPAVLLSAAGHKVDKVYESLKRKTYRGKPTRKYLRYVKAKIAYRKRAEAFS